MSRKLVNLFRKEKITDAKHDNWYDEFHGALDEVTDAQEVAIRFTVFLGTILGFAAGLIVPSL